MKTKLRSFTWRKKRHVSLWLCSYQSNLCKLYIPWFQQFQQHWCSCFLVICKNFQKYEKQTINVFKIVLKLYGKIILSFNKASNLIAVLIINYISIWMYDCYLKLIKELLFISFFDDFPRKKKFHSWYLNNAERQ